MVVVIKIIIKFLYIIHLSLVQFRFANANGQEESTNIPKIMMVIAEILDELLINRDCLCVLMLIGKCQKI